MSFYDDSDPNRSPSGQFYNHVNANVGEQWAAGVHHGDSYMSAHAKTEMYRRANNLDPFTGVPLPPPTYGGSGSSGYYPVYGTRDESQIGKVFGALFKILVFWPAVIAIVVGAIGAGIVFAGMAYDAPTLGSRAAEKDFAAYRLAPMESYFNVKELAEPVDPAGFMAAWHAFKPSKGADPKMLRLRPLQGQAYRCMMQPGCRAAVAKIDPYVGEKLPLAAGGFFMDLIKRGDAAAARDMCLFAAKGGTSFQDLITAHNLCTQAVHLSNKAPVASQAMAQLDGTWSMTRALAYEFVAETQYRWAHQNP